MDLSHSFNESYDMEANRTLVSIYAAYIERQIMSGVTLFASFVGLLGNLAVIVAVLKVKKLQTTTNVFVLNLAVADVLTCTVAPLQAVTILNDELVFPLWLCQLVALALVSCIGCSINCLALIAVNRLVRITTTATYHKLYTPCKLSLMVATSWCVPVAVAAIPLFSDYAKYGYNPIYNSCTWESNKSHTVTYAMFIAITYFPVQFVILFGSYIRIYLFVRKTTRSTLRHLNSGSTQGGNQTLRQLWKRQVAVTKNLFLVVCVFLICLSPYFLTLGLSVRTGKSLLSYASTILMANSSVNPIIYGTKHPDFRTAFAHLWCSCMKNHTQTQPIRPLPDQDRRNIKTNPNCESLL